MGVSYLSCKRRRFLFRPKELHCTFPFGVFDLLVVQEPNARTSPDDPMPVILKPNHLIICLLHVPRGGIRTSFLVTGFSSSDKWVSLLNFDNGSKSASSERLFAASAKTCRFGMELARVGWMVEMRFRARRSVFRRSERGKLPSCWMSLSVKSIASCGWKGIGQLAVTLPSTLLGEKSIGCYS